MTPSNKGNKKPMEEVEAQWRSFKRPQDGATYTHYKGGAYSIVTTGFLEESETPCVVYRSRADGTVWVRTAKNFLEEVEYNGEHVPRFVKKEAVA